MRRTLLAGFLATAVGGAFVSGSASAQTCAPNIPHITGTWTTLPYQMPINPISANVLTNGKVLIVAGSENDAKNSSKLGEESYRAAVWDPTGTDESSIAVQNLTYDVFCSGTAALPDGRSLVVGGTSDYSFKGDNRASIFDPRTGKFAQSQSMVQGRWYATATTLGDGRVMAMSGLTLSGSTSTTVEIYDLANAGTGWMPPTSVPFVPPLYPRVFLLPNGTVFYTGQGSGGGNANAWIFNPTSGTWTVSAARPISRSYGSSVILPLLPPNYTPRVMNFGGGNPATRTTEIIDLSAASPSYAPGPNMSTGRIQMNAVILPNGKVLAEGGSVNNEAPDTPGKTADLYDPVTNTFSSAGAAAYSRLYHSVALLLPDATVVSMGSNPGSRGSYLAAMEIYTPSYLFDANDQLITTNRPSITALSPASGVIGYGTSFSVSYTSTSAIASAVLVRPGSATHAVDMEQRLIGLCGASPQPPCSGGTNTLDLTTPSNSNVAPPGYYMLFLLDDAGVPSTARFIQLTQRSTAPPVGAIAAPSSDVTISAGGAVAFGTSTIASKYSWVFSGGSPATSTAQNPGNVTFPNAGTYQVSLTVIDSSNNSDPSPPTRTITVLPTTPDFSISIDQAAQEVAPGESAAFTVRVTPQSGFTGTVNLSVGSESGFPAGITSGGFSPTVISGAGSSMLTMNTTTSTIPWALSLTVTGTSGTISHIASTTLLVNLAPPASLTATPGDSLVSLSWPASIGATSYHAKRATASGGPYQTLVCLSGTSYTDTGLTNGVSYFYVVSGAFSGNPNAGGESADSDEASAIPQAAPDTTLPTVGMTAPANGATVSGSVTVSATAADNVGVVGVQFLLDGANLGAEDTVAPYTLSWNSATVANGVHTLSARARDAAGNQATASAVSVTVANAAPDTTLPTVGMTAPANGATVSGSVTVSATAADNVGVVGVQFLLDGANLGVEDTVAPYTLSWNSATVANGVHTLSARARDAAGNQATATAVSVTVANAVPTGLVAGLAFNESSGTSAADAAGNGHTGTLVNGPTWVTGQHGNGLSFDGVNDSVTVGNPATLNFGADFTIAVWVKRNALGGGQRHILAKCSSGWASGCKELYFAGNTLRFGSYGTGDTNSISIADTNWHHVAVVFTRSTNTVQLYVDGTLRTTAVRNLEADGSGHVVTIGNMHGSNPFSGVLDEVRIYSQALSAVQIATAMATPLVPVVDTTPPVLSGGTPSGTLAAGTTQATLGVATNENATCRYGTTAGVAYGSLANTFGVTGGVAHTTLVTGLVNGQSYTYYVRCQDAAGNATTTDFLIAFAVAAPDTTLPTVGMTAPANGATVSGSVTVSATAADNVGVVGVQFLLDGANLGAEDTVAPYTLSWNSATVANGVHTLSARARDAAGNQATASAVSVTVANAAPDTTLPTVGMTAPANGATVSGSVTVSATAADNVGVVGVQFLLDGANLGAEDTVAPYTLSWNSATVANGVHTLSARARDAAGNQATASAVSVTVANAAPDTTLPTVGMTAPANGATVSGSVTVSATAADNVGVVGVQFLLDGANLGVEDTVAPYTLSWNSATVANGVHTLSARARDAAGNQATATAVSVTVANAVPTGLVAGLAFNESSGTSAADAAGNGHTGTLVNGPTWVTGQHGNGLSFDGVNDSVTVGNPATLNFGTADFTVAVWVKRNALGGSGQRHILAKCSSGWASGCKELYFAGDTLRFGSYGTGDTNSISIADTNWHHVAVVFTRSTNTVQIYVDGTLRTTAGRNLEADGSGHVVTVGNMHGSNPFSGLIDEVRVYDQALNATQIASAMATPL